MKKFIAIAAAFGFALSSSAAVAQATLNSDVNVKSGASINTPGHKMQNRGSVKGTTGASGYAPGQRMQTRGSVKGTTSASGYAPGHIKSDTNIDAGVKTRR
jgi:hypothetical protein